MKEGKNLFSIGEIAKAIGITRRIILNYEDKGLIVPDKKESNGGNRYYTIDTFPQIRTIRLFQNLGLSLDEIREYFEGTIDLDPLINRLEKLRDELNLSITKLKERADRSDDIKEILVDKQVAYCRTHITKGIANKTKVLRDTALEAMKLYGTDTTRRMYFIEYDINNETEITYGISVPPKSLRGGVPKRYP